MPIARVTAERKDMTMQVQVNGTQHEVPDGWTLTAVLAMLEAPAAGIAVAVNREVVPRTRWAERELCSGDRIDIVRAIGGG
jgi:sulfur carrier protein